jgi:ATP-dependent Clp protease protease subunit
LSNETEYETSIGEVLLSNSSMFERPIKHFAQVINVTIHHFYINGEIEEDVDRYIELIHILKTSEAHDKIYIYLNTPGGNLTTTIQICAAMSGSHAEVITVIEGEVCSAGTFIFLAGHSYVVNDNCSFMIHNYSHGTYGKGAEVAKYVKFSEKYFNELARSFYTNFLTPDEIKAVCEDSDFWMNSKQVIKRLEQRADIDIIEDAEELPNVDTSKPIKKRTVKQHVKTPTKKKAPPKKKASPKKKVG